jgi:hypothetical protein
MCLIVISLVLLQSDLASAQPGALPARGARPLAVRGPRTEVSVELLTGDEGVGLSAHRWHEIFERLQMTLTVRRAVAGDQMDVTEQGGTGGALRKVHVIGKLEKSGRIVFTERAFTEAQAGQLAKWLRDLQEFGAQGSPTGRPAWGLTKGNFTELFTGLAAPQEANSAGRTLTEALSELGLPAQYKVALSAGATKSLADRSAPVRQSTVGVSKGCALAILLSEYSLGFRPRRQGDGVIELQIATPAEASDLWPIGWPLQASNPQTAPKYFALTKIALKDETLDQVLAVVPDLAGLPIMIDYRGLAAKNIDLSKVKVSHPSRQTTWSLAMKQLTFPAKAQPNLVIDEAGKPFVWVTPLGTVRKANTKAAPP